MAFIETEIEVANARIAELEALLKPFADIYKATENGKKTVTFETRDIYKQAYLALSGDKKEKR